MTMRSWTLVMVPLFSVSDPLFVKLTIFKIWPYLKLSIFSQQLISPKLLYLDNPEDLGNDVFFWIFQNFSVFRRGPNQKIFEIFEKVEFY